MDALVSKLRDLRLEPLSGQAFTGVPEPQIAELERLVGRLPEDYRFFLNRYGLSAFGGSVSFPSSDIGPVIFGFFYGANGSGDGVLELAAFYAGQFPRGVVPFGEDGFGNLFLVGTSEASRGGVYYWWHCDGWEGEAEAYRSRGEEVPESLKYQVLDRLAGSFSEFVLGLRPDVD